MKFLREHKWLILSVVIAFIVRLVLIYFNPRSQVNEDTGIEFLAMGLASGKGYGYYGWGVPYTPYWIYPPGAASLLALIFVLFGAEPLSYTYVRILQSAMDIFGCVFIYLIGKELFNKNVGLISAFIYAIFLPIAFMSTWTAHDALLPFFSVAALYCFVLGVKRNQWRYYVLTGLVVGISCYFQPTTMLLPFMFGLGYLIYSLYKANLKAVLINTIKNTMIMFAVMAAVITPWIIRNSLLTGTITPMRSAGWVTIYCGWGEFNDNPDGILLDDTQELAKASKEVGHEIVWGSKEYEDYFRVKVIDFAKEHPMFILQTIAKRIPWSIVYRSEVGLSNYPDEKYGGMMNDEYYKEYPQFAQVLQKIRDGTLIEYVKTYPRGAVAVGTAMIFAIVPMLLAGVGIWAYRKRWRELALIGTVPLYYFMLAIFTLTINSKNKVPGYVGYIIFSALAIYYIYSRMRNKEN